MALLDGLTGGSGGGILSTVTTKMESFRPHILGELNMKSLGSGGFLSAPGSGTGIMSKLGIGGGSSILSARQAAFTGRLKGIQTAPTVVDKLKSLLMPPGTTTVTSSTTPASSSDIERQYYQQNPVFTGAPASGTAIPAGIEFH